MERTVFDKDKFISLVQPNPCLWDTEDPDYCDRNKKQQCWMEISEQMCDNFEEMAAIEQNEYAKDLQGKWKNLRNSFARELAKRKKKRSGDQTSWKTYAFFEQLSFLMPCSLNKEPTTNFTEENQDIEENDDAVHNIRSATHVRKKKKISPKTNNEYQIVELVETSLEQRQINESLLDNDADRHFLLSLLPDFKRLPIDKKMDVKLAMIQSIKSALLPTQSGVT